MPTTDRERRAIDSGEAGDKIAFPDPAAAPLGTDAEASGNPPTRTERQMDTSSLGAPRAQLSRFGARLPVVICVIVIALFAVAIVVIALMR